MKTEHNSATIKMSALLSRAVLDALTDMAARNGKTVTETLARAVSHQKFIHDAGGRGAKILVREENGAMFQVAFPGMGAS